MYRFDSCGTYTQNSTIVLKEKKNKRRFIGLNINRKEILKVQVDHCLSIDGRKCDWLLIDTGDHAAHFIELKGCEVKHALDQLEHSITLIADPQNGYIDREFSRKQAYVIASRIQPKLKIIIQRAKFSFFQKYRTRLTVKNIVLEQEL